MKLKDILKTVGSAIIAEVVPGGSSLLNVVNKFLPPDRKVSTKSTGTELTQVINSLPADQQYNLWEQSFEVKLEEIKQSHETNRTMLELDAICTHTTRPYIAKGSFLVVAFVVVLSVSTWSVGVLRSDDKLIEVVVDGWPFLLAAMGPLVALLRAYFGILKQEHQNTLDASRGVESKGILHSVLGALSKKS